METTTEQLVRESLKGSREALEEVVRRVQGSIYALALRMLFLPADAEDATQEILIKVITRLKTFRFEGPFQHWVMKVAANHLKTVRKGRVEKRDLTLEKAQELLDHAEAMGWFSSQPEAPEPILEVEIRSACAQALLLTLDRNHRLAFVLGVVMDVSSREGGFILEISPAAFRKRLSRARQRVMGFLTANCGLFNESNACRCSGILTGHLIRGWINPQQPLLTSRYSEKPMANATLVALMKELEELERVSAFYKSSPENKDSVDFTAMVKDLVEREASLVFGEPEWDNGNSSELH